MTVSVSNLTGGPAKLLVDDTRVSHTQGGITVNVAPQQRMRIVDEYGSTPVDVVHTGDDVRVTSPMAEWTDEVIQKIYNPGRDQVSASDYLGVGRSAGYIYTDFDLKVVPLLAADAGKYSQFYRCTPIGELELGHNSEDDRIFNLECVCMADPEGAGIQDGELVGKIFNSASAPTTTTTTTEA